MRLVFSENFADDILNRKLWSPYYLPHWAHTQLTEAHYSISNGVLSLYVDQNQLPWCPEFDGDIRVSALQTGQFSGPIGSRQGQHRFKPELIVRQHVPLQRLYTPTYGRIEIRARASIGPRDLVSAYLIGLEEDPLESGEITVFEIFGDKCFGETACIGRGIKRINDQRLETEFLDGELPLNVAEWHEFALDWQPSGISIQIDGATVFSSRQAPNYPMQLMITCYQLGLARPSEAAPSLDLDYVKGYELVSP